MEIMVTVLDKKNARAAEKVDAAFEAFRFDNANLSVDITSPQNLPKGKGLKGLLKKTKGSQTAVGCVYSRDLLHRERLTQIENTVFSFEGRIYSPAPKTEIANTIARKIRRDGEKTLEAILKKSEGDYSLIIVEPRRILAARDPVGVQPLYYGENADFAALGSNRRILHALGMKDVKSFPPGHLASITRQSFRFKPVKTLAYSKPKRVTIQRAAATLQEMLERSVRLRVRDVKEVAVAFSGGLDSSTIAFSANKCDVDVHLIHVSLANQPETEEAKKAAAELKLPLSVCVMPEEDVEKVAAKVVELIEEPDPVMVAIGIPFYWTAEKAAEAGYKVLLAGQGADELFGGYQRYVTEFISKGEEEVGKTMFNDVSKLHESNIERDRKICAYHGVELRLPFASFPIAEFSVSLPVELKIERNMDSLRKLVLRKAAENMGLPPSIVKRPKRAMQYATGVNVALKKLAKRHKMTVADYVDELFRAK